MSVPISCDLASLLLSAKANQLGHDSIGTLGRRLTQGLLILSAILGYLAGVTGLTDLVGKTTVAVLGIAAGVTTTSAILALTMQKPDEHLRIAGEYELLFSRSAQLNERNPEDQRRYRELREEFDRVVERSRLVRISLSNGQVSRCEGQARDILASAAGEANALKAKLLNVKAEA
jgi:hypothetical protein